MDRRIIDLWADIGTKEYWSTLMRTRRGVFYQFEERCPQPGFIGKGYFNSSNRTVVLAQNPGVPSEQWELDDDEVMLDRIRTHGENRLSTSLDALFALMPEFMLGHRQGRKPWRLISVMQKHLGLELDDIAYLNLSPLSPYEPGINPAFRDVFELSTKRQLEALNPDKVVVLGKGVYEKFRQWSGDRWDTRHIQQRNFKDTPSVREWLISE